MSVIAGRVAQSSMQEAATDSVVVALVVAVVVVARGPLPEFHLRQHLLNWDGRSDAISCGKNGG